jgi:hypothetical protein
MNVNAHLGELALSLGELRQQFRNAARIEVARAVGDALRQFAVSTICGSVPRTRQSADDWDDPWTTESSWPHEDFDAEDDLDPPAIDAARIQAAVLLGIGGARWAYLRTRHPAAAIVAGVLLLILALAGGRPARILLDAWSSANILLRDEKLVA